MEFGKQDNHMDGTRFAPGLPGQPAEKDASKPKQTFEMVVAADGKILIRNSKHAPPGQMTSGKAIVRTGASGQLQNIQQPVKANRCHDDLLLRPESWNRLSRPGLLVIAAARNTNVFVAKSGLNSRMRGLSLIGCRESKFLSVSFMRL